MLTLCNAHGMLPILAQPIPHPLLLLCRWALYDIARNPVVQQRIAQELAAAGLLQVGAKRAGLCEVVHSALKAEKDKPIKLVWWRCKQCGLVQRALSSACCVRGAGGGGPACPPAAVGRPNCAALFQRCAD